MPSRERLLRFILLIVLVSASPLHAEEGKEIFQQKCSGCHTVGGGDTAGPDLKGVAGRRDSTWLMRIIVEPDALTREKDPTQTALVKKYGMEMPKLGISREDATKIIAFLGGAAPAASGAAAPAEKKEAAAATPQQVARGTALFTGATPFAKGGPPCAACHRLDYRGIAGGSLGANLSGLYGRMGEAGVSGILSTLQFPVMKGIYAERPLTDEERGALLALWKDEAAARPAAEKGVAPAAQAKGGGEQRSAGMTLFPLAGIVLFILFIIGFALYNRRAR